MGGGHTWNFLINIMSRVRKTKRRNKNKNKRMPKCKYGICSDPRYIKKYGSKGNRGCCKVFADVIRNQEGTRDGLNRGKDSGVFYYSRPSGRHPGGTTQYRGLHLLERKAKQIQPHDFAWAGAPFNVLFLLYRASLKSRSACIIPRLIYAHVNKRDAWMQSPGNRGMNQDSIRRLFGQCRKDHFLVYVAMARSARHGHANVLYINKKDKQFSLIDPNGANSMTQVTYANPMLKTKDWIGRNLGTEYKENRDHNICPLIGPQGVSSGPLCALWACWIINKIAIRRSGATFYGRLRRDRRNKEQLLKSLYRFSRDFIAFRKKLLNNKNWLNAKEKKEFLDDSGTTITRRIAIFNTKIKSKIMYLISRNMKRKTPRRIKKRPPVARRYDYGYRGEDNPKKTPKRGTKRKKKK